MNLPASSSNLGERHDTTADQERLALAIVERRQLARMLTTSLDELRNSVDRRHAGVHAFKSLELTHAKLPSR
jgi:hypothetical protein